MDRRSIQETGDRRRGVVGEPTPPEETFVPRHVPVGGCCTLLAMGWPTRATAIISGPWLVCRDHRAAMTRPTTAI